MRYYMSMSGTFRAFVQGKITLDEIKDSRFIFGPHKDGLGDAAIPNFVLCHNTEKPKWAVEFLYVTPDTLDKPVLEQWTKFRLVMKEAEKEGRITWTDGINYPAKIKPLVEAEHEVFWDGQLLKAEEFKYMTDA